MNLRLLSSLLASVTLTFFATSALGVAISPPPLKVIAYVVAHAHPQTQAHWIDTQYAHGL